MGRGDGRPNWRLGYLALRLGYYSEIRNDDSTSTILQALRQGTVGVLPYWVTKLHAGIKGAQGCLFAGLFRGHHLKRESPSHNLTNSTSCKCSSTKGRAIKQPCHHDDPVNSEGLRCSLDPGGRRLIAPKCRQLPQPQHASHLTCDACISTARGLAWLLELRHGTPPALASNGEFSEASCSENSLRLRGFKCIRSLVSRLTIRAAVSDTHQEETSSR